MSDYFQKEVPLQPVTLPNGQPCPFIQIDANLGIFESKNPNVSNFFRQCIAQQRGGLAEINQAQYEALLKKKPSGTKPIYAGPRGKLEFFPQSALSDTHSAGRVAPRARDVKLASLAADEMPMIVTPEPPETAERSGATAGMVPNADLMRPTASKLTKE